MVSLNAKQRKYWARRHKREQGKKCVKQTTKKYTTRPSPPFPANQCPGKKKKGNDGNFWKSTQTVTGIYTWKRM